MLNYISNSPFQDSNTSIKQNQNPKSKRQHPDRLKVNLWGRNDASIKEIRLEFNIPKNLIMRKRGVENTRRVEIWCSSRTSASEIFKQCQVLEATKKKHIALGKSYYERKKARSCNPPPPKDSSDNTITIMHWNARSLRNKVDELKREITESNAKIICIQESSLPKCDKFHPIFKNFTKLNLSRNRNQGGGVVTLVHNSLHIEDSAMHISKKIEYIKSKLRVTKDYVITLVNVYIPNQGIKETDLDVLMPDCSNYIILGDLNSKHSSWNEGPENRNGPVLFRWIQNNNITLMNQNKTPTYQSPSTGALSTLDLSLMSPSLVGRMDNWRVGEDLGSDHFPVFCDLVVARELVQNPTVVHAIYNMKKANWRAFKEATSNILNSEPPSVEDIEHALHSAADGSIPRKNTSNKPKHVNDWWTSELNTLRKARQKARKKWKAKRDSKHRAIFNKHSAMFRKAILSTKRESWRIFVTSINSNTPSATIWKKFRSIEGDTGKKIEQIKSSNGEWLEEDLEKAEAFNAFYKNKADRKVPWPNNLSADEKHLVTNVELLTLENDPANAPFNHKELSDAIRQLHSSAPGEDNIHNDMLINCSPQMLKGILQLFNNIWSTGDVPQKWKTSTIIPLSKPGKNRSDVSSYRPIALTSCLGKLMERLVNNRLLWILEYYNHLDPLQFGFRKQRSTSDALQYLTNKIYGSFQSQMCTVMVLLDCEAAFDKIPHSTILLQCMKLGIKGKMLQYLTSFLENRKIKTVVNGVASENTTIENGIVQGAVISPSLFNIALHDMSKTLPPDVDCVIYADDITLITSHKKPQNANKVMQSALNQIEMWCQKWSLKISTTKTECAFFTRRNIYANYEPQLTINKSMMKMNTCPKLLGVLLDKKLRWKDHIEYTVGQCGKRLNAIKAVAGRKWGADTLTLKTFYIAFVRSKLTYCSEIWGSAATTHIRKLEQIQSAALRTCLGCPKTTPIAAMEIELGVEPLDLYITKQIWYKNLKNKTYPKVHPSTFSLHNKVPQSLGYKIEKLTEVMPAVLPEPIPPVFNHPPWINVDADIILDLPSKLSKSDLPELLQAETLLMINTQYLNHEKIYTDGSVDLHKSISGAGYFNQRSGDHYYSPSNATSSMDAELLAINAALCSCLSINENKICILSDSKSALEIIRRSQTCSYNFRLNEIRTLLVELKKMGKHITLQWVPAHCGITGNEKVDKIAKEASLMTPNLPSQYSLTNCKKMADAVIKGLWTDRWNEGITGRNLFSIQKQPSDASIYRGIPRCQATFGARARIGHIACGSYLYRFNLADTPTCQLCKSSEETLDHILLRCPTPNPARSSLKNNPEIQDLKSILENKKHWKLAVAAYNGHRAIGVT